MRELLERLFQVDFIKGLLVTFRMQNPKEIVTEQYPLERPMVAERYRGAPRLNNHPETGETLCIGCNLCALACPENLIVVGWLRDDATRRKVLRSEEHTSELQSRLHLVCRLLLEKKKKQITARSDRTSVNSEHMC